MEKTPWEHLLPTEVPVQRVEPVLDKLDNILEEIDSNTSKLLKLNSPELAGANLLAFNAMDEPKKAEKLLFWTGRLAEHLELGGSVDDFCSNNVWFIPLVKDALAYRDARSKNIESNH